MSERTDHDDKISPLIVGFLVLIVLTIHVSFSFTRLYLTHRRNTTMSDRTFNVKVAGFTPGGYALSLETAPVEGDKLKELVGWIDERFHALQIQPALFSKSEPIPNSSDGPKTRTCPIHDCEMQRHEKNGSYWYSHKVTGSDGTETWCRGT